MLEKMNKVTATRYVELKNLVSDASESLTDLKAKCRSLLQHIWEFYNFRFFLYERRLILNTGTPSVIIRL